MNSTLKKFDIPLIIGGKEIRTGKTGKVVMPSEHEHLLATYHMAGEKEIEMAVQAALDAKCEWMTLSWMERAAIMIKAAELISKKYRFLLNASTMLGQGKNVYQAEIDSACEVIDYLRFNAYFASLIYKEQPLSDNISINRLEYRPLEGFIFTVTPFNFTAIASNLNTSVALMGNTTLWKPATSSLLSNYYFMKILEEAGLPDGVINFVPGTGSLISSIVLKHKELAGIHFTGSNSTLNTSGNRFRKIFIFTDPIRKLSGRRAERILFLPTSQLIRLHLLLQSSEEPLSTRVKNVLQHPGHIYLCRCGKPQNITFTDECFLK